MAKNLSGNARGNVGEPATLEALDLIGRGLPSHLLQVNGTRRTSYFTGSGGSRQPIRFLWDWAVIVAPTPVYAPIVVS